MDKLTAKEAIEYVLEIYNIPSKYRLAKNLSDDVLTVQPIQISHYLKGKKMSKKVARRFFDTFEIIVIEVY